MRASSDRRFIEGATMKDRPISLREIEAEEARVSAAVAQNGRPLPKDGSSTMSGKPSVVAPSVSASGKPVQIEPIISNGE